MTYRVKRLFLLARFSFVSDVIVQSCSGAVRFSKPLLKGCGNEMFVERAQDESFH